MSESASPLLLAIREHYHGHTTDQLLRIMSAQANGGLVPSESAMERLLSGEPVRFISLRQVIWQLFSDWNLQEKLQLEDTQKAWLAEHLPTQADKIPKKVAGPNMTKLLEYNWSTVATREIKQLYNLLKTELDARQSSPDH